MRTKEEVAASPTTKLLRLICELQDLIEAEDTPGASQESRWWINQVEKALENVGVSPKKTRNFL